MQAKNTLFLGAFLYVYVGRRIYSHTYGYIVQGDTEKRSGSDILSKAKADLDTFYKSRNDSVGRTKVGR